MSMIITAGSRIHAIIKSGPSRSDAAHLTLVNIDSGDRSDFGYVDCALSTDTNLDGTSSYSIRISTLTAQLDIQLESWEWETES